MNIFKNLAASLGFVALASTAGAVSVTGGIAYDLPHNFSGTTETTSVGVGVGTEVLRGATLTVNPLQTWQLESIRFMGSEAGFVNFFNIGGVDYFNPQPALGTQLDVFNENLANNIFYGFGSSFGNTVNFTFVTVDPASSVSSGDPIGFNPGYALVDVSNLVPNDPVTFFSDIYILALFNDKSTSDRDYDDFMVLLGFSNVTGRLGDPENPGVNPVPLPAAAWMLLAGLGGLGYLGSRKGKNKA